MGCGNSLNRGAEIPVELKPKSTETANETIAADNNTISSTKQPPNINIFKVIKEGLVLLCKDEFVSKYTGEKMCRWRKSEVKTVENPDKSRIHLHYIGWSDNFDFWLDLNLDWSKVAPVDLLSKNQCDLGLPLTEEQERITLYYLQTGKIKKNLPPSTNSSLAPVSAPTMTSISNKASTDLAIQQSAVHLKKVPSAQRDEFGEQATSNSSSNSSSNNNNNHSNSNGHSNHSSSNSQHYNTHGDGKHTGGAVSTIASLQQPTYYVGQMLDIQDIFYKKTSDTPLYKWRKASILKVVLERASIRIHYLGWDAKFDETLHLVKDAHRISGYNTMSATVELSKMQHKLPQFVTPPFVIGAAANNNNTTAVTRRRSFDQHNNTNGNPYSGDSNSAVLQRNSKSAGAIGNGNGSDKPKKRPNSNKYLNWLGIGTHGEEETPAEAPAAPLQRADSGLAEGEAEANQLSEEEMREQEAFEARERLFCQIMVRKGLHVIEIEGDGNCLFRAVSHQLYLDESRHEELRARCVKHLIQHKERFEMFCSDNFDEHIEEMSHLGTWGDDLEIRALEEITDRLICIYCSDFDEELHHGDGKEPVDFDSMTPEMFSPAETEAITSPMRKNFEEDSLLKGVHPLSLSYHGQNHYNSVYNERIALPLETRNSRVLLKARMNLFHTSLSPATPATATGSVTSSTPSSSHRNGQDNGSNSQNTYVDDEYHKQMAYLGGPAALRK